MWSSTVLFKEVQYKWEISLDILSTDRDPCCTVDSFCHVCKPLTVGFGVVACWLYLEDTMFILELNSHSKELTKWTLSGRYEESDICHLKSLTIIFNGSLE